MQKNWFDVIFIFILGGSFAENFYGLKRVSADPGKVAQSPSEEIPWSQTYKSLLCLVSDLLISHDGLLGGYRSE